MKPMVMSNVDEGDMLFHNDRGSWNVTRAIRDCKAGKHKRYVEWVADVYASSSAIEYDEAKVAAMMAVKQFDLLIGVIDDGKMWLIDGRHRLEVMHRRGDLELFWYIIEEADAGPYRVLYNGKRKPPFKTH